MKLNGRNGKWSVRSPLVVGSGFVAKYPDGGGNYWVPLQYLRGFRDLGVDAFWLEVLESTGDVEVDRVFIDTFLARAVELGISDWTVLAFYSHGFAKPEERQLFGSGGTDLDARLHDAVLLNLAGSLRSALRQPFRRTILYDLDPGLYQIWAEQWGPAMGVGQHDVHLTIGQHLGAADSPVPLLGVEWHKTWPAVHLPSWEKAGGDAGCYTTVTQWWSPESASRDGELYDCSKRNSFLQFLDMPRRSGVCLELAANIHPCETADLALLASNGWRRVEPEVVARTPQLYRDYISASRGEFGCAKPAYVKARPGWISDRTVCYLASGRPCIVQDTGAAEHLPRSRALQFFTTGEEAVEAIRLTESDYPGVCAEARAFAEEWFSTEVVLPRILDLAWG
jgi:hypothetical protein